MCNFLILLNVARMLRDTGFKLVDLAKDKHEWPSSELVVPNNSLLSEFFWYVAYCDVSNSSWVDNNVLNMLVTVHYIDRRKRKAQKTTTNNKKPRSYSGFLKLMCYCR